MEPNRLSALCALLANDPVRLEALAAVAALMLPDGWIGAGFVRAGGIEAVAEALSDADDPVSSHFAVKSRSPAEVGAVQGGARA